jgi:hypothetical protein
MGQCIHNNGFLQYPILSMDVLPKKKSEISELFIGLAVLYSDFLYNIAITNKIINIQITFDIIY